MKTKNSFLASQLRASLIPDMFVIDDMYNNTGVVVAHSRCALIFKKHAHSLSGLGVGVNKFCGNIELTLSYSASLPKSF